MGNPRSLEDSIRDKINFLIELFKFKKFFSLELKTVITLLIIIFATFGLTFCVKFLINLNEVNNGVAYCSNLSNINDYFNNSNLSCSCFYEKVNTGNLIVDLNTKHVCTCNCWNGVENITVAVRRP